MCRSGRLDTVANATVPKAVRQLSILKILSKHLIFLWLKLEIVLLNLRMHSNLLCQSRYFCGARRVAQVVMMFSGAGETHDHGKSLAWLARAVAGPERAWLHQLPTRRGRRAYVHRD